MDPGPCFVYVPELLKSPGSKTDNYSEIKLVIFNTPGISTEYISFPTPFRIDLSLRF